MVLVGSVAVATTSTAHAAPGRAHRPIPVSVKAVPHSIVSMPKQPTATAPVSQPVPAAVWPAGTAAVALPASQAATTYHRAGTLPIELASASKVTGSAQVAVVDRATALKAGVNGLLFSVTPATTSQIASVAVDYSRFSPAAGADWTTRLRLVRLPACALTSPQLAACQVQSPVVSSNDSPHHLITAAIPATSKITTAAASAHPAPMVLAAVSGASGSNGSFTGSSLSPSGSWAVSGASGAFDWHYPLTLPPAAAGSGVAPQIALSYNSTTVDGEVASTNNQSSWLGEGWDYSPGFIERTYRTCSDDPNHTTASNTGDLCWAGQIMTMNLGGSSTSLVQDDATGAWHAANDSGQRVEHLTGSSNGAHNGEYWKITTTDGVQYFFGRNGGPGQTTQAATNSTWTEPVYSPHSGDDCYVANTFSSCSEAWRWNLDYVEDPHGNAAMYYYTPEINYYGANNATTGVKYTRGGVLDHIDYGLLDESGSVYAATASDRVSFTSAERCIPDGTFTCTAAQFTAANAGHWVDTPYDQQCLSGATCNNHSPTFWSRLRLTTITTSYYNGSSFVPVDAYALGQIFPSGGDPELRLESITRTGYSSSGTSLSLLPIKFTYQLLDNRVHGFNNQADMLFWRLTDIATDTGSAISVSYSQPNGQGCTATTVPAHDYADTTLCFPVYWTPVGHTAPSLDYFDKYVVTRANYSDVSSLSPNQLTTYTYLGAPAWHFDDNEVVKPANRTYGQFRGYAQVEVRTGDTNNNSNGAPDKLTLTRTTYFRGMNGNPMPADVTAPAVFATDSLSEQFADGNVYADNALETQTFDGDSTTQLSTKITNYALVATTASRARTGLPTLTANTVATSKTRTITNLLGTSTTATRQISSSYTYDSLGRLLQQTDSGDSVPDLCTTTSYADNTTSWIRNRVSEQITSSQVCPSYGTTPAPVLADTRTYYDSSTTLGSVPAGGFGDATETDTATAVSGASLHFAVTKAAFDSSGRPTSKIVIASPTDSRTTTSAYTPADGGPLTQTVISNALHQTNTVTLDPGRGATLSQVDIAGHRTDATYDQLGRLTAVWKPGQSKSGGAQATETYAYLMRTTGPLAVTTKTLIDVGGSTRYQTSVNLYDAFGALRQTQTDAENSGQTVTDTFYDSHGWAIGSNNHWYTSGSPSTAALISTPVSAVDDRTLTSYDGTGRPILVTGYHGLTATDTTQTVYGGDRTTVIPPTGGITSTTISDARGNTTTLRQYLTTPTVAGDIVSGGSPRDTSYQYTPLGQQSQLTDPAGNNWTSSYDLAGRVISQSDPDSGPTSSTYDDAGDALTTKDARLQVLAFHYDALGRKDAEYLTSTSGTKLASWTWDTLQKGQLTSSTRYTSTGNYVTGSKGYDGQGNPMGSYVIVPASETGLAGTYTTLNSWTSTHLQNGFTPASGGGLTGEPISINHTSLGNPTSSLGYNAYVSAASYDAYGHPIQYTLGTSSNSAWLGYTYDPQTFRLTDTNLKAQSAGSPQLDDLAYSYDPSGNLTRSVETLGNTGAPVRTQCNSYDALDELSQSWTATDNCAAAPNTLTGTANVGGPTPFWTSWTFDPHGSGNRAQQTQHALTLGGTDTTTNYAYQYPGHTHALASTATTGPAGPSATSYAYDDSGNTTSRAVAGGTQTLSWDTDNRLASVSTTAGTTSYVYDADGHVLLRHDPGSSTLYLPGEELTRTTATATTVGTRYYSFNGTVIALRVGGADPTFLDPDPHGSNQLAVNSDTFAVTRRTLDPYGNPIGTGTGTWLDSRVFLNKPLDSNTGLTDVGARSYDTSTGVFESVDPVLNSDDPQATNGYGYASNNPIGNSDPTGLQTEADGGGIDCSNNQCTNSAINTAYSDGVNAGIAMPSYDNFVSTVTSGTPTGNFTDVLGGIIHALASAADSPRKLLPSGSTGCFNCPSYEDGSNKFNKTFHVNTNSLAYDAGGFATTIALLINPDAALDGIADTITAGRALINARKVETVVSAAPGLTAKTTSEASALLGKPGDVVVLGRQADTAIAKSWQDHVVLDTPNWSLDLNDAFIREAIDQRRTIYLASPIKGNLIQTSGQFAGQPTIYARELDMLRQAGYSPKGDNMVPPS